MLTVDIKPGRTTRLDVRWRDARRFEETKHPRGQPGNAGEFAKTSGGKSVKAKPSKPPMPTHTVELRNREAGMKATGYVNPSRNDVAKLMNSSKIQQGSGSNSKYSYDVRGAQDANGNLVLFKAYDMDHWAASEVLPKHVKGWETDHFDNAEGDFMLVGVPGLANKEYPYQIGRFAVRFEGILSEYPDKIQSRLSELVGIKPTRDAFEETKHPRGQPENAGQFAPANNRQERLLAHIKSGNDYMFHETMKGIPKKHPDYAYGLARKAAIAPKAAPYHSSGTKLPSVVYRGFTATHGNEQRSSMAPSGVYVSADPGVAKQYGNMTSYQVHKQPNLLDLKDHNGPAKALVAAYLNKKADKVTKEEFDEAIINLFVQNEAADQLKPHGFDGYRLGADVFLVGNLSDYAKPTHDAFEETKHPRGQPENKVPALETDDTTDTAAFYAAE
jgi:hypothetical protein